jgi:hypothetical protein
MLTGILLHLTVSGNLHSPLPADLQDSARTSILNGRIILAGRRKAPGPDHGDDPNGGDPNDEQHDGDLPANAHKHDGYPSKDPYNGTTKNGKSPWLDPPES